MLKELEGYDWEEAFKYAAEPEPLIGEVVSRHGFNREAVVTIFDIVEGDNDGPPWRVWGKLRDGRFFYLEAGCDYTDWG